jgi:hypothetical protein
MAGHVACIEEMRNWYVSVGNPEWKDHLEGDVKMDLKEINCEDADWIHHHLLSLALRPSLGLGLLLKIRLNFLEAFQQFFTG